MWRAQGGQRLLHRSQDPGLRQGQGCDPQRDKLIAPGAKGPLARSERPHGPLSERWSLSKRVGSRASPGHRRNRGGWAGGPGAGGLLVGKGGTQLKCTR